MEEQADQFEDHRDNRGRFTAGNPGGGRPKGARSKLGESFFEDLQAPVAARRAIASSREMAANDPGALWLRWSRHCNRSSLTPTIEATIEATSALI